MVQVALEVGPRRRVFAQALGWIGWCRGGRDEEGALAALRAAAPRYAALAGRAGLAPPADDLRVVERVEGNATTDFGAPARPIGEDAGPLDGAARARRVALLTACWSALDAALAAVPAAQREVKPRSGRAPAGLRYHVAQTDVMHLSAFGPTYREPDPARLHAVEAEAREAMLAGLAALPLGERFEVRRRYGFDWTPLFAVRRAAWHALDHAWELEDRAG